MYHLTFHRIDQVATKKQQQISYIIISYKFVDLDGLMWRVDP